MSEITRERQAPAGVDEQSTTGQAKEKVQEAAGEVRHQAGEKAQQLRGQAADAIRDQLDSRSTQAGEQVAATAGAVRRVGGTLRAEGNSTPARYAERVAEPVERLGRYLTQADGDRILRDAEQFARRRPWLAVAGGATVGFIVARFVKASGTQDGGTPMQHSTAPAAVPQTSVEMGGIDGQSGQ